MKRSIFYKMKRPYNLISMGLAWQGALQFFWKLVLKDFCKVGLIKNTGITS
jgi:hypothetical protein